MAVLEQHTGLAASDPTFITASGTLSAQSGLSVFASTTAIGLIVMLEPPRQVFTAETTVSADRRPRGLTLGLFIAFAVVPIIPATRNQIRAHRARPNPWSRSRPSRGVVV